LNSGFARARLLSYNYGMLRSTLASLTISILIIVLSGCSGTNTPIIPPDDNPDFRISVSRLNPNNPAVDAVVLKMQRLEDGKVGLPGRTIEVTASRGSVGLVTDRGDGAYEAIWTGSAEGEVVVTAKDMDSDPQIHTGITFLALDFLLPEWDVPVKLMSPISTDGWDTAAFLYPGGDRLAFGYITLDLLARAAGITRPIGEERPGQATPQMLNIYIAERPNSQSWWTGWTVENAAVNLFQALPMNVSAPSVSSDGMTGFFTVQEFDGASFGPTKICKTDADFVQAPVEVGAPVDMTGLGEDNPYFDATNGWLYFDTYDLGDPLSKQNLWTAQSVGGGQFDDPVPLTDLNTFNVETQPFMHEPSGMLYFASDRWDEEFVLSIWRASVIGSYTGTPEKVAGGALAVGRPSISYDGKWFCFVYVRLESGGANADIAMCRRIE